MFTDDQGRVRDSENSQSSIHKFKGKVTLFTGPVVAQRGVDV
jgi:hypothetical protein